MNTGQRLAVAINERMQVIGISNEELADSLRDINRALAGTILIPPWWLEDIAHALETTNHQLLERADELREVTD